MCTYLLRRLYGRSSGHDYSTDHMLIEQDDEAVEGAAAMFVVVDCYVLRLVRLEAM